MCPWENASVKDARKYRCPLKCDRIEECPHAAERSPGSYEGTVHIKNKRNLRFLTHILGDSQQYQDIYAERTACECLNNRVLNDYCLQNLKIRSTDHFSFWSMPIGICIHQDARYKAAHLYID